MRITPEQRQAWLANTADGPFNRWLDAQVKGADGRLDLERLYALARRFGIDKQTQYAGLNPGQQRMSIGNLLRRIVPESDYACADATDPPDLPVAPPPSAAPDARPPFVAAASVRELLQYHGLILDELRRREVVRTSNAPGGDYAELLFARAFGWKLENSSASGHDATDDAGVRYQVKSRRLTPSNGSRQLSAIRRLPDQTFDYLAGVLFDPAYCVVKAAIIPHALVLERARRKEHTNSWAFMLEDVVWDAECVRDVTEALRAASYEV
jgi:hypothetical protein